MIFSIKSLATALCLFFIAPGLKANPIIIDETLKSIKIGASIEYLEDKNKNLKIKDITDSKKVPGENWKKSPGESLSFGYSPSAFWIRFEIKNNSSNACKLILTQSFPLIRKLDLYVFENKNFNVINTGYSLPFNTRPIKYRTIALPLKLDAGQTQSYYLRYDTIGNYDISLTLFSLGEFQRMKEREAAFLWIYYGILIIMFVYNLFLFFTVREPIYIFYVLYILSFTILDMSINGIAYQYLWSSSPQWAAYSIPFSLNFIVFSFIQFARHLIQTFSFKLSYRHLHIWDKALVAIMYTSVLTGMSALLFTQYRLIIIITLLLIGLVIFLGVTLILILSIRFKVREAKLFLYSYILFFIGCMLYIFKSWGIIPESFITDNGIKFGAAAQVVFLSLILADKINTMNLRIKREEKKYRNLVESSGDIIFSLDNKLNILSINTAIELQLGYPVKSVINKNFMELIEVTWAQASNIAQEIVEEYVTKLMKDKVSVSFRTFFSTHSNLKHEPKELSVNLEYAEMEGGEMIILGKASLVAEDQLLTLLKEEKQRFFIGNYLNFAEIMSQRLTRNLGRYFSPSVILGIRVSLRELLINAIEHGNLNVTFDDKTRATDDNKYLELIKERQKDPVYKERMAEIEYVLTEEKVSYKITDQGEGFDYSKITDPTIIPEENRLLHGRGLMFARETFDVFKYNKKGNQVLVEKYVKPS